MDKETKKRKSTFVTLHKKVAHSMMSESIESSKTVPDSPQSSNAFEMIPDLPCEERSVSAFLEKSFIMDKETKKRKSTFVTLHKKVAHSMMSESIESSKTVPDSPQSSNAFEMIPDLPCEERSVSAFLENLSMISPEKLPYFESKFKDLMYEFINGTSKEILSRSILQMAAICQSQCFIRCPAYKELISTILRHIRVYRPPGILMFSQGLFLSIISQQELDMECLRSLKEILASYFESINAVSRDYFSHYFKTMAWPLPSPLHQLTEHIFLHDFKLKVLLAKKSKAFYLWCGATVNILYENSSMLITEIDFLWPVCETLIKAGNSWRKNTQSKTMRKLQTHKILHRYKSLLETLHVNLNTVKHKLFVQVTCYSRGDSICFLCRAEFDITLTPNVYSPRILEWLMNLEICFNMLQNILTRNKPLVGRTLNYANSMLLSNIDQFLVCIMEKAFASKDNNLIIPAIKRTIIPMLQTLLSLSTIQCSGLEKTGSSLMKSLLSLIIQVHFSRFEKQFEIQVMALEACLLILSNQWVTIGHYCSILSLENTLEGTVTVDALIKVLVHSLEIIKNFEKNEIHTAPGSSASGINFLKEHAPFTAVQQLGEVHMQHNFITSYVSVLLALFCTEHEVYKNYVKDKIQRADVNACIKILEKFKEFLVLLGNFNANGKRLIDKTHSVFQSF